MMKRFVNRNLRLLFLLLSSIPMMAEAVDAPTITWRESDSYFVVFLSGGGSAAAGPDAIKYSIAYADGVGNVTDATYESGSNGIMVNRRPFTLTAYAVQGSEQSANAVAKYFGFSTDAVTMTYADGATVTMPQLVPTVEASDGIVYGFEFGNDGVVQLADATPLVIAGVGVTKVYVYPSSDNVEILNDALEFTVTVKPIQPTVSPVAGAYLSTQTITLTADGNPDGTVIHYNWDGGTEQTYSSPIAIQTGTLNAWVVGTYNEINNEGNQTAHTINSETTTAAYTVRVDIANATVATVPAQTYTGSAITPDITVSMADGATLTKGMDYTVEYSNNTVVATANSNAPPTITITGIGGYTGTKTVTFDINKAAASLTTAPVGLALTYNGSAQALVTAGAATGGTLQYSLDGNSYSTELPTATAVGTYTVYYKVVGDANHTDVSTSSVSASIGANTSALTVTLSTTSYTYDGAAKEPSVTVSSGTASLSGTDYDVSYSNNVNAGTATVTVAGKGNYAGATGSATFVINKAASSLTTAPVGLALTYNGSAQALVTAGAATGGTLQYSLDGNSYSTELPTATAVGTYTVYYKVVGDANHTDVGASSVSASIGANTSVLTVTLSTTSYTYDGAAKEPSVTVSSGTASLSGTDYDVSYSNNVNAGTATVTVAGKGNYAGATGSATFVINKTASSLTTAPVGRSLTYNGSAQTLVTAGSATGGTLEYSLDGNSYSTELPTATAVGTYTVYYRVVGDANHTDVGASSVSASIGANTSALTVTLPTTGYTYDGAAKEPSVTVSSGTASLSGTDYDVSYSNNVNAGTATVTVAGKGNYAGATGSATFVINKAASSLTTVPTGLALTYNGSAQALVTGGAATGGTLQYSLDGNSYSTELPTATAVGTYTVYYRVVGDVNHTDVSASSVSASIGANASALTVTLETSTYTYDGTEKRPEVTVTQGSSTLEGGIDYNVEYTDNMNAGMATVTVTGRGNYDGATGSAVFTIGRADAVLTIAPAGQELTYNGSAQELVAEGAAEGGTLQYSLDGINYSLSVPTAVEVGSYIIYYKVEADGNHNDIEPVELTATINPIVETLVVSLASYSYAYDGTEKLPEVTVTLDGRTLVAGDDYNVTYTDNVNVGEATVTVTGMGNYEGSMGSVVFTISQSAIEVSFPKTSYEATLGEAFTSPQLNFNVPVENPIIIWTSSNETVAKVNADGSVEIIKAGTTTITVRVSGGENFDGEGSASYQLTVLYPLWVNDVQVGEHNRKDILGDGYGSVQFDGLSTLFLGNGDYAPGGTIRSGLDELTIYLKGVHIIKTITGTGKLVISTNPGDTGSLVLDSYSADPAVSGFMSVLLKNGLEWLEGGLGDVRARIGVPLAIVSQGAHALNEADFQVAPETKIFNKKIDEVLYTHHISSADEGDAFEGAQEGAELPGLVWNTQMTDGQLEEALKHALGSEEFAECYTGLVMRLSGGVHTVSFDAFVGSGSQLMAMIGAHGRIVSIPRDASGAYVLRNLVTDNPTYLYIFNRYLAQGFVRHRAKVKTTTVKIYSFKVSSSIVQSYPDPDVDPVEEHILSEFNPDDYVNGVYTPSDTTYTAVADGVFDGKGVSCIDLSQTKIKGQTFKHGEGAFTGVGEQSFIYLPAGNTAAEGDCNVVIGSICEKIRLSYDDSFFKALKPFGAISAEFDEGMTAQQSMSVYWPFEISAESSRVLGSFYAVKGLEAGEVLMESLEGEIAPNTPCILVRDAAGFFTLENLFVEPVTESTAGVLWGNYKRVPFEENLQILYQYVSTEGKDGHFVKVQANNWLTPYMAYLQVDVTSAEQLPVSWTGVPSGIRAVEATQPADDDAWYTLQGVRLTTPPVKPGLYIYRGKKTVRK